jgi:cyclophilin family peptidyl-prolyl cis-trans isomerase
VLRLPIALIALLALLLVAGCGDDDSSSSDSASGSETELTECRDVEAPEPKPDGGQKKPADKLDPGKTYKVDFETSCGSFTVQLDVKGAPNTAASFASLVESGFYDDTVFHRIVPGFVVQGGDPTGTGTGGPGYKTVDRPAKGARYTQGVVAMAKTGAEPPGTAGSQFFVVTGPDAGLPPDYAIVGEVISGGSSVQLIERLGDPNSGGTGTPLRPAVLEKATLSES